MGIAFGDRVVVFAENRIEWIEADLAVLAIGAVNVPLYASLAPPQARFQIAHSDAVGVILAGKPQFESVARVIDDLPLVRWIVSFEDVGQAHLADRPVLTWLELIERGSSAGSKGTSKVIERERLVDRSSLATILYTSGTTGDPKGVMLSHGNFLSNAESAGSAKGVSQDDLILNWLPFSHVYGRLVDEFIPMVAGSTVALAESLETVVKNLEEIQPTWMASVPRFYEKLWNAVVLLPLQDRSARLKAVFGPKLRGLSSGGAPLAGHIARGFQNASIELLEGYGLSESSPVVTFNRPGRNKPGTVGQAIPGVEIKTAEDGEILTKGPHVMLGYWKDPEATRATIIDGWLYTGDVGTIDEEGFLSITDRKKEIIVTSGGKNVAPSEIERLLTSDPIIDQAVVFGDRKPYLTAILVPNVQILASRSGSGASEVEGELIVEENAHHFINNHVHALMQNVSPPERVRSFLLLNRPLSIDLGELTNTLKPRRKEIFKRFSDRIEALYKK